MFGKGAPDIVRRYQVRSQSSKVAINADGVITMLAGYGRDGAGHWRTILDDLRR